MQGDRDILQPERWTLKKFLQNNDWHGVEKICNKHFEYLNDDEHIYYIKAKYKLKKYLECYDLCHIRDSDNDNLKLVKCQFKLRSSILLEEKSMIEQSIELYYLYFPNELEPKISLIKTLYSENKYAQCILLSDEVLVVDEFNRIAILFKARSLTKIGVNTPEIKKTWFNLLKISDNNLEALNNISRAYLSESDYSSAEKFVNKCLSLDPSYTPAKKTKKNISKNKSKHLSSDGSNYREMYAIGLYSEIISELEHFNDYQNWNSDELLFLLRSLNREKRYTDIMNIYDVQSKEINLSNSALNEIVEATVKLELYSKTLELMNLLKNNSNQSHRDSYIYLRNLIYYTEDEEHISSEISLILSANGDSLLTRIVQYILKSAKYSIMTKIFDGEEYLDILDPVQGSLREKIGETEYSLLWEKMHSKITHSLDRYSVRKNSENSYVLDYADPRYSYFQFLLDDIIDSKPFDYEKILQPDSLNDFYTNIKNDPIILDNKFLSDWICICTNNEIKAELIFNSYELENFIHLQITSIEDTPHAIVAKYENRLKIEDTILKIQKDPRIILGRFISMLPNLPKSTLFFISWLAEEFSNIYPNKILIENDFYEPIVAAKINGYSDDYISILNDDIFQ